MKDRHIHIAADTALLKNIYQQAEENLVVNKNKFRFTIWSKLVFYCSCVAITYSSVFFLENTVVFILIFVLYGFSVLLFAFNFAHDFSHGTIFRKPFWDNLGFILIYTINGAHGEAWKQRHIESHHFAPNVEHYDSDLEISTLIRVIPDSEHRWYHRYQHLYAPFMYTTYSLFWVFVKDFTILFSKTNKHRTRFSYHLSFWSQKLFYFGYLLVLPLLFSHQPWHIVIIAFLLMHLAQSLFLLFTFFMTHHVEGVEYPTVDSEGHINASWLMNQVKSSNDMYPFSRLANFIFGGFNNHVAHHLFPHVHHIHYPELNKVLYATLMDNGIIPNQTTYWTGIRSHLRLLKKMGVQ